MQRAVVLEPGERKLYTMVQQLNTIRNAKVKRGTPICAPGCSRRPLCRRR